MGLRNIVKSMGSQSLVIAEWDRHLATKGRSAAHRRPFIFHPSSIHVGQCMRRLFFQFVLAPENGGTLDANVQRIFDVGHSVHVRIQTDLKAAGILEAAEVPVCDPKHRIFGTADGVLFLHGKRMILEIKSINKDGFERLCRPDMKHECQLQLYMNMAGIKEGVVLYECKDNQRAKEYLVTASDRILGELLSMLDHILKGFINGEIPEKGGDTKHSPVCRFCPYTSHCFDQGGLRWLNNQKWEDYHAQYASCIEGERQAAGGARKSGRLADIKRGRKDGGVGVAGGKEARRR